MYAQIWIYHIEPNCSHETDYEYIHAFVLNVKEVIIPCFVIQNTLLYWFTGSLRRYYLDSTKLAN